MGGFAAFTTGSRSSPDACSARGSARSRWWLMLVGIHLFVVPMFLAGLEGQPVDVYKYFEDTGVDGYNLIASIGAFILVRRDPARARQCRLQLEQRPPTRGHDPWGGSTLEWFALSPPPPHNFDAVPDVRSTEPLRDIRDAVRRAESFAHRLRSSRSRAGARADPDRTTGNRLCSLTGCRRRRRGDAGELARFRRLVSLTIVATLVLILIGGIVRVSDSGLGCGPAGSGTQGWPLCEGGLHSRGNGGVGDRVQPPRRRRRRRRADRALVWQALRRLRSAPLDRARHRRRRSPRPRPGRPRRPDGRGGPHEELVAAHLGLAMLLLGLLIAASPRGRPRREAAPRHACAGLRAG